MSETVDGGFRAGEAGPCDAHASPPIAFQTERLRVFVTRLSPTDHNCARDLFVAFRTDEDRPLVCATAMVMREYLGEGSPHWVDWLEVTSEYRREGFGRELLRGLERWYGRVLAASGGSEVGELFCAAVCVADGGDA